MWERLIGVFIYRLIKRTGKDLYRLLKIINKFDQKKKKRYRVDITLPPFSSGTSLRLQIGGGGFESRGVPLRRDGDLIG